MPRPFNRGEVPQGLAQLLALKGDFPMEVEQLLIPTVNVADLTDTPYLRYGIPCGERAAASAVAARQSGCIIRPGRGKALQIRMLILHPAAGAKSANINILTAANIAAINTVGTAVQLADLAAQETGLVVSSSISPCTAAAITGNSIGIMGTLAGGQPDRLLLPDPITLYGNDPAGVPALAVWDGAVNEDLSVSVLCREWPLPGI